MKIAVRGEGGIGDIILACRFIPEIKKQYPDSTIDLFIDSEGKIFQKEAIEYLYPDLFNQIKIIPSKKYKEFYISSQFGDENQKGFIENVPNEILSEIKTYDKFYDLHIDSLKWIDYNFDFNECFSKLIKSDKIVKKDGFIISNLISSTGTEHVIKENWWLDDLIVRLDNHCKENNLKHYILCTENINNKYETILAKTVNTSIFNGNIKQVIDLISNCNGLVGIDSAWRLVSHIFDKPTVTISKNCQNRGQVPLSHQLRWLIHPKTTFGIYNSTSEIVHLLFKMLENNIYSVYPEMAFVDNLDNFIIKRNYKVNLEKSILN